MTPFTDNLNLTHASFCRDSVWAYQINATFVHFTTADVDGIFRESSTWYNGTKNFIVRCSGIPSRQATEWKKRVFLIISTRLSCTCIIHLTSKCKKKWAYWEIMYYITAWAWVYMGIWYKDLYNWKRTLSLRFWINRHLIITVTS